MNISRSAYVMLALQRLNCTRETGDLHIPMFASSYSKIGKTNDVVATRELHRAEQNGQSQRLPLRSILSSSALGTGPENSQVIDGPEQGCEFKRLSLGSDVSYSVLGTCAVNTGACDGTQHDGECERIPLRSVLSSFGLGTSPVNSQILDVPEQDGQFECLSLGWEVSSSVVGSCAVNTGACNGVQLNRMVSLNVHL